MIYRRPQTGPLQVGLLCVLTIAQAGCDRGGEPTGQLTGKVTLKGQPVDGAAMVVQSTTNPDDVFTGGSSRDGKYQVSYRILDGLPVGRYKVMITVYTLAGGVPFPPGEKADELRNEGKLIESSYVFEHDIAAGANTIDFELTQGQKLGAAR
jgi:hypothetical protein